MAKDVCSSDGTHALRLKSQQNIKKNFHIHNNDQDLFSPPTT